MLIAQNKRADGDLLEAEMLARKIIRVKERNHGRNNIHTKRQLDTLHEILELKGGYYNEVEELSKWYEAIQIKITDSSNDEPAIMGKIILFCVTLKTNFFCRTIRLH
jgi:hypothetical protein